MASKVELVRGDFESATWGGAQVDRFHVIARRRESGEAVIWSPDHPQTCSLGDVAWYDSNQPLREGGLAWGALGKAIVPFIDAMDDQGRGTLRFSGADCKALPLQVDDVDPSDLWTAYDSSYLEPTYVARTSDQRLMLGHPNEAHAREVAHGVTSVDLLDEGMWLVEDGEAVFRDATGKELARTGHGVDEMIPMGQDELVYIDQGGLFHYVAGRPLRRFATDVCSVSVLSGFPDMTLAYLSPCGDGALVIDDGKHPQWHVQEFVHSWSSTSGFVVYETRQAGGARPVWLASASAFTSTLRYVDPLLGDLVDAKVDSLIKRASAKLLLVLRQSSGNLELFDVDTDHPRAQSVVLDADPAHALVMTRSFADRLLTLDASGTLELRRLGDLGRVYRASQVSSGSIRTLFGDSLPALGYLRNIDPATSAGDLELYFVERGEQRKVASYVRELHQVWWPETGVLYSTTASAPGGAALWFARVTVPCSQTTGAPWTCL